MCDLFDIYSMSYMSEGLCAFDAWSGFWLWSFDSNRFVMILFIRDTCGLCFISTIWGTVFLVKTLAG